MPKHPTDRMERRIIKRRKLRKRAKFILLGAAILFISLLGFVIHIYIKAESVFSEAHEDDGRVHSDLRQKEPDLSKDNVSILIMGVDTSDKRGDVNGLSDALMVATLSKKDKSVKLVSIPRDSYVSIPGPEGSYNTRINHAHSHGGPLLSVRTVEELLDIPIDYWVSLNFHAFIDVVEAINGITVDVPYEFYEQDSRDKQGAIHLLPGEQLLNGEEALALARTRKLDNDIERGKRQQDIIKAVMKKSTSLSSILKLDKIIDAVGDNMTTSMEFQELKSFVTYGTAGNNLRIDSYTLEGEDYQPGNMYFWKLDEAALEETKDMLKQHLNLKTDDQLRDF